MHLLCKRSLISQGKLSKVFQTLVLRIFRNLLVGMAPRWKSDMIRIANGRLYNWSGFPDLLPNQMEGYCTHWVAGLIYIRPATQCLVLMPPNQIRECSTREFIEPTLVMIWPVREPLWSNLPQGWNLKTEIYLITEIELELSPVRTQSRFNWDSQDQEGNRIPPISWEKKQCQLKLNLGIASGFVGWFKISRATTGSVYFRRGRGPNR